MFESGALLETGRRMAGEDSAALSEDELLTSIVELEQAESLLATARAHVLAELDVRGTTDRVAGLRTTSWVAREAERNRAVIGSELRVGRLLREVSVLDDAVSAGMVSMDHARVIAKAT